MNGKAYRLMGIILAVIMLCLTAAWAEEKTGVELPDGAPLYPACKDNMWGYIDAHNNWVIEPHFWEEPPYIYKDQYFYEYKNDRFYDSFWAVYDLLPRDEPEDWGVTEINGIPIDNCWSQAIGDNIYVCFRNEEKKYGRYMLFNSERERLNDQVYTGFYPSEDEQYAIVQTEETEENTGDLIDAEGQVIRANVPFGELSADGQVIRCYGDARGCWSAETGEEISEREAAALHAAASDANAWPIGEKDGEGNETYVYLDGTGEVIETLERYQYATEFVHGIAYVITLEDKYLLINTKGETVVENACSVGGSPYYYSDAPLFREGLMCFRTDTRWETFCGGGNYLREDGTMLYPACELWEVNDFFEGRALIGVLLPDYSIVYAYINKDGRITWAQEGTDIPALQVLLDAGKCPNPADMTPEEAEELLFGDWVCTGGGEHLGYNTEIDGESVVSFREGERWHVRRQTEDDPYWGGQFVLVSEYEDEEGQTCEEEIGLGVHCRDLFWVYGGEGGSSYARFGSIFDDTGEGGAHEKAHAAGD
ncbi:MAG: WG repeat-containing protein [Clostridia bacterium]|nr:WG repeat-containing protein [Clostridia bacterium]